jgi:CPA2 family monovalent cation:H+ antiporter-2
MSGAHAFLQALAVVLCVAAVTTVLFQRLRQPVVLGYILAGVIVGPHVPVPLVADAWIVQTLSELGVILLMFALGLEFSLRNLLAVGPTAGITGVIQCSVLVWLGYVVGLAFGWTQQEALFTGAIIAISSTTIIAKAFEEQGIRGRLRELVVGVLIVEDLIAILLMATLTAVASGAGLSAGGLLLTIGRLVAFLVGLMVVGLLVVPRMVRFVVRLERDETTLLASIGLCFAIALLAHELGYSVALGAFLAGSLVAESGEVHEIERLVLPVRDVFAAIFFVSVGMMIDPALLVTYWVPISVLTLTVVAGKIASVALGAFFTGNGVRTSVQAGMSLAQIGEFSFIIAGLGLSLKATGEFLYPVAVAVSALTTLTTPWLIRASGPVASAVDRKLPKPLQTFVGLYGSWLEQLRTAPRGNQSRVRRLAGLLLMDAVVLSSIVVASALTVRPVAAAVTAYLGVPKTVVDLAVVAAAIALCLPFGVGIVRCARSLGVALAERALPVEAPGRLDLAAAARKALIVSLEVLILAAVVLPVVAITQPVLPGWGSVTVVLALFAAIAISLWRSTTDLDAHVRAGAQVVVEALARQSALPSDDHHALDDVRKLLPGLGEPEAIRLPPGGAAVGRSLAELDLRGVTGATVLAISRGEHGVAVPAATEVLREGDVLAVAGTHDAVEAARALLCRMRG